MTPRGLDRTTRRRLHAVLLDRQPWLGEDLGPAGVDPGDCGRCRDAPRLVPTCGPVSWRALCRDCLLEVGDDAFCPGHADDATRAESMARALPEHWATLTRLSWIASGQVRADRAWLALAAERLADPAVAVLLRERPPT